MLVIELVAGPGAGKSTLAAKLFSQMKTIGYNVEMVGEYAKDLFYGENHNLVSNQLMVFSEQLWRMRRLKGKVDIIITDSPLLLSLVYSKEPNPFFKDLVLWEYHNDFKNLTYFLERDNLPYQEHGRFQKEEEAKEVDNQILKVLSENNIEYKSIKRKKAKKTILKDVSQYLNPTINTETI